MTVTASVSDPDGDLLVLQWTFGDGGSASGPSASHVYAKGGAYTITLSAADGRGEAVQVQATVVVRSMDGRWFGGSTPMVCGQDGARFDCFFESAPRVGGFLQRYEGEMRHPRRITGTIMFGERTVPPAATCAGDFDDDVNTFSCVSLVARYSFSREGP